MIRLTLAALLLVSATCDPLVAVLVAYGCDTEPLVIESAGVEIERVEVGEAPMCFLVAQSIVGGLTSRCLGGLPVPVQRAVFDPAVECQA